MILRAVQLLKYRAGVIQQDIAPALLLVLGQGHGAGIQIHEVRIDIAGRHMGVACQQDAALGQRGQILGVIHVAVGGEDQLLPHLHNRYLSRHARETVET